MKTMKVGIIGCGKISSIYMENCHRFEILDLVAVADIDRKRAEEQAAAYNVPNVYTVDEMLANPEIELIINLTIPAVHADVCLRSLEAGKHVYVENHSPLHARKGRLFWKQLSAKDCWSVARLKLSSDQAFRPHSSWLKMALSANL